MQQTIMIGGRASWVIGKPEGLRKLLRLGAYSCPVELRGSVLVHKSTGLPVDRADFAPTDLTGSAAAMEIRSAAGELLLRLTHADRITLGGPLGTIEIAIGEDLAADIAWTRAVFGLVLRSADGTVRRVVEGDLTVSTGVVGVLP